MPLAYISSVTGGTEAEIVLNAQQVFQHVDQRMNGLLREGNRNPGPSGKTVPDAAASVAKKLGSSPSSLHCGFAVRASCVSAIKSPVR